MTGWLRQGFLLSETQIIPNPGAPLGLGGPRLCCMPRGLAQDSPTKKAKKQRILDLVPLVGARSMLNYG